MFVKEMVVKYVWTITCQKKSTKLTLLKIETVIENHVC